jgi:hypothetical protein
MSSYQNLLCTYDFHVCATYLAPLILLYVIILITFVEGTNYEAPQYAVFSG